jgi:hypothetical protein
MNNLEFVRKYYSSVIQKKTGRSSRGKHQSLLFYDGVLYSYGAHYPLARVVVLSDKYVHIAVTLINTSGYSVTTAKHISYAKRCSPYIVIEYSGNILTAKKEDIIAELESTLEEVENKKEKARAENRKELLRLRIEELKEMIFSARKLPDNLNVRDEKTCTI